MTRYLIAIAVVLAVVFVASGASAGCNQSDGSTVCAAQVVVDVTPTRVAVDVPGVSVDVGRGRVDVDIRRRPIVRRWFRPIVRVRIGRWFR